MATLSQVKASAAGAVAPRTTAPTMPEGLPAGSYKGRANVYSQTINGSTDIRMGEIFSVGGKRPKADPDNGYPSKTRSRRRHLAVADVTFVIA